MTGRGSRVQAKRLSIGEVRPGRSTSTIWSGPKNSSKPPRKWPRDLTTTERARPISSPIISKKIGSAHCTRCEITTTVTPPTSSAAQGPSSSRSPA